MVDWAILMGVAGPVLGAAAGVIVTRALERRPRLITYYGHVSSFKSEAPEGPVQLHTHDVVVRNSGGRTASNVRLGHFQLPDFQVNPSLDYQILDLPDGSQEILFPKLVPGEQVVVSYLYFPPTTWNQVNAYVKSDEGLAKVIPVLLQQQFPTWITGGFLALCLVGLITTLYWAVQFLTRFFS
jgi:hypothetical protein